MGVKLEHAINQFASVGKESNRFSLQYCVDDWDFKQQPRKVKQKKYGKLCNSMDRFLDKQNIESIRNKMQDQEEVFKHQVRELHRLYSVQKMLMDELQKEMKQKRQRMNTKGINPSQCKVTNHPNLTSQATVFAFNSNDTSNFSHEIARERSGSCSGDARLKTRRGIDLDLDLDLERPADQEDVSAVDHDNHSKRLVDKTRMNGRDIDESDVELTLSIGLSSSSSKSYQREMMTRELDSSASFKSDNHNQDCSGSSTPMSSSSTTIDQERKRPHWLFQGLSINKT